MFAHLIPRHHGKSRGRVRNRTAPLTLNVPNRKQLVLVAKPTAPPCTRRQGKPAPPPRSASPREPHTAAVLMDGIERSSVFKGGEIASKKHYTSYTLAKIICFSSRSHRCLTNKKMSTANNIPTSRKRSLTLNVTPSHTLKVSPKHASSHKGPINEHADESTGVQGYRPF